MTDPAFPPVTRAQWQAQAEAELRGRPLSSLTRTTTDGIAVAPVYLRDDPPADALGQPAVTLGRAGLGTRATTRWRTVQDYRHADPEAANAAARRDLELGADGAWFVLDGQLRAGRDPGSPADGLVADPVDDLALLLAGIDPRKTPVFIDAGLRAPQWADAVELYIDDHASRGPEAVELGRGAARGGVVYDPFTPLLQTGSLELGFEAALTEQVDAVLGREVGLLGISTCVYHDAGASDADELALALASFAELLRRGVGLGLEAEDLASSQVWTLAIGGRPFEAIAKLRAARVCWAKLAAAAGLSPEQRRLWIHASASQRTWTRHGAWVNLLRGTVGTFAAALGGADSIATASFDGLCGPEADEPEGLGRGSELGRRLAIDTQVLLREESGLDRTLDPAGGSGYVESLTDALARAAWQRFRAIEAGGGLVAGLLDGSVQGRIGEQAAALRARVATRKQAITGVSSFPVLTDEPPPIQEPNLSHADTPEPLRNSPVLEPAEVAQLPVLRLAAPFERLRDASEAWLGSHGARPQLFALCLGPFADHQARAEFAANLFAAGGLAMVTSEGFEPSAAAIASIRAAFEASGCAAAVICGRDPDYVGIAGELVAALRAGGARAVWIAGRPPAELGEWGLDPSAPPAFIHLGGDALAAIEQALAALGVSFDSGASNQEQG
jgi:methylmalonyl-CoA mutase